MAGGVAFAFAFVVAFAFAFALGEAVGFDDAPRLARGCAFALPLVFAEARLFDAAFSAAAVCAAPGVDGDGWARDVGDGDVRCSAGAPSIASSAPALAPRECVRTSQACLTEGLHAVLHHKGKWQTEIVNRDGPRDGRMLWMG